MKHLGTGLAIIGIWGGSAVAIHFGASDKIFLGATIATICVAFFAAFYQN